MGLALPLIAAVILGGSTPSVAADLNTFDFTLGLRDAALRTVSGAEMLRRATRMRLVAARVDDFSLRIDSIHHEVNVRVHTALSEGDIVEILTARGHVKLVESSPDDEVLREVGASLPDGVVLDWVEGRRGGDLFLAAESSASLRAFVSKIALADYRLLVGRMPDSSARYRTFLVKRGARELRGTGLLAVNIIDGRRPNFHALSTYWRLSKSPDEMTDVVELTAAAKGGTLLLIIDGEVQTTTNIVDAVTDGELRWRMPDKLAAEQLVNAQKMAGKMASGAYPCDIVVVKSKAAERRGAPTPP